MGRKQRKSLQEKRVIVTQDEWDQILNDGEDWFAKQNLEVNQHLDALFGAPMTLVQDLDQYLTTTPFATTPMHLGDPFALADEPISARERIALNFLMSHPD